MPAIIHQNQIIGQATNAEALVKDTVGFTGKNLLKNTATSRTINGITFTVNVDGSITISGTSTAQTQLKYFDGTLPVGKYLFNGCVGGSEQTYKIQIYPVGGSAVNIDDGEEKELIVTNPLQEYRANVTVYSGTAISTPVTLYPMLRKADITDPTYEPYHESVQNQLNAQGVLGAKNLMINEGKNETINGVAFTVNEDGSITANGTASTDAYYSIASRVSNKPLKGLKHGVEYILSGDKSPATDSYIFVNYFVGSTLSGGANTNNGEKKFTIPNDKTYISYGIGVKSGKTVTNKTFYPMIRLASDPDDTYQPYAMTNRELTDGKADKTDVDSNIDDIKSYLGILTTPVPSYVANTLPVLRRNITSAFYNGSLRGEIAAGNFKNVRPGDYIIGQATGSTYYVAMCDYRLGKGDRNNNANYPAYGTHHLGLILFKPVGTTALWRGYGNADKSWRVSAADLGRCPWNAATDADPTNTEAVGTNNTNITRTYNGANVSGYMGSFIRERIDAILLPQCFQADFGSANVLKYREINGNAVVTDKPSGGQGNWNGCTSGWGWYDRYLDLPSEVELYGSRIFGSGMDTGCQCEQLPLFRNAAIHDFYPRIDIWTKGVASSSSACYRSYSGLADDTSASNALWACPLACVK